MVASNACANSSAAQVRRSTTVYVQLREIQGIAVPFTDRSGLLRCGGSCVTAFPVMAGVGRVVEAARERVARRRRGDAVQVRLVKPATCVHAGSMSWYWAGMPAPRSERARQALI